MAGKGGPCVVHVWPMWCGLNGGGRSEGGLEAARGLAPCPLVQFSRRKQSRRSPIAMLQGIARRSGGRYVPPPLVAAHRGALPPIAPSSVVGHQHWPAGGCSGRAASLAPRAPPRVRWGFPFPRSVCEKPLAGRRHRLPPAGRWWPRLAGATSAAAPHCTARQAAPGCHV